MKENPAVTLGTGALKHALHSFSPEVFDLNLDLKSAFAHYRQTDECQISSLLLECFFFLNLVPLSGVAQILFIPSCLFWL